MFIRTFFSIFVLIVIFSLESKFPYFKDRKHRYKHALLNLVVATTNALVIAAFFSLITAKVIALTTKNSWGLLHVIETSYFIKTILAFVLLDLWMYAWHVANHRIFFLWRFHRMHHTDKEMDSTTALRFHMGEILISSVLQLMIIILLLGVDAYQLSLYGSIFLPIIIFHHSNVALPEKWDRLFRSFIVTPNMHRVHHSQNMNETNSNFSSVFSIWDRLFRSFRKRKNTLMIHYGIKNYSQKHWYTLLGMFSTPFKK